MADIKLGLNTEAFRHADKSLEYSLEATRRLGYRYVELNVQTGRDLFSEAGYSAQISMERDPLEIKEKLDALGLKVSGLSAHSPMAQPEVSIPFLTQAIRFADELGAPCVNTDEGVVPEWMGDAEAFAMIRYTLKRVLPVAERHKVHIALEPHQKFTVRLATYKKILDLVKSPYFNCNPDTGNLFISGTDPYKFIAAIAKRVVHVHAKDIGGVTLDARGKLTGVPSGCACGDGVIDWPRVVRILRKAGFKGVLAVECGTEEQAARSIKYLRKVLRQAGGLAGSSSGEAPADGLDPGHLLQPGEQFLPDLAAAKLHVQAHLQGAALGVVIVVVGLDPQAHLLDEGADALYQRGVALAGDRQFSIPVGANPFLRPGQDVEDYEGQRRGDHRHEVGAHPDHHPQRGHEPDARRGRQAAVGVLQAQDGPRADEADAGDDPRGYSPGVEAERKLGCQVGKRAGREHHHRRAQAHHDVGPQAGGPPVELPLQADRPAEHCGHDQADDHIPDCQGHFANRCEGHFASPPCPTLYPPRFPAKEPLVHQVHQVHRTHQERAAGACPPRRHRLESMRPRRGPAPTELVDAGSMGGGW